MSEKKDTESVTVAFSNTVMPNTVTVSGGDSLHVTKACIRWPTQIHMLIMCSQWASNTAI